MQQISEMSFKKSSFLIFQYKTKQLTSNPNFSIQYITMQKISEMGFKKFLFLIFQYKTKELTSKVNFSI